MTEIETLLCVMCFKPNGHRYYCSFVYIRKCRYNMNQTEMAAAVKKMQTYVALAEQEISARNEECQLLQDELAMSRRLRESLEEKLREIEETLCRQQSLRRVSQFMLKKIESGGTIQVWMTTEEPISPANTQEPI